MARQSIVVTKAQMERIDDAFMLCAYPSKTKICGELSRTFRAMVAAVVGFEPGDEFELVLGE